MDFEWDPAKAAANRRRHGVSFEEASEVYGDPAALTGDDVGHSSLEHRERTLGRSHRGRVLVVISTGRAGVTRIITARKATRNESRIYEEEVRQRFDQSQ